MKKHVSWIALASLIFAFGCGSERTPSSNEKESVRKQTQGKRSSGGVSTTPVSDTTAANPSTSGVSVGTAEMVSASVIKDPRATPGDGAEIVDILMQRNLNTGTAVIKVIAKDGARVLNFLINLPTTNPDKETDPVILTGPSDRYYYAQAVCQDWACESYGVLIATVAQDGKDILHPFLTYLYVPKNAFEYEVYISVEPVANVLDGIDFIRENVTLK